MLEDRPPLVQPEPRESQTTAKAEEKKAKNNARTKVSKKKNGQPTGIKKKSRVKTVTARKKRSKASKKKGITAKPKPRSNQGSTG